MNLQKVSDQVATLTREVGEFVLSKWQTNMSVVDKGVADYQTQVDIAAEKRFAEGLKMILPEADIQGEEIFTDIPKNKLKFVIDPIDGTRYFVSKAPFFCCQVALLDGDDVLVSIIYLPVSKQLFQSTKGFGAYLDGQKLAMSECESLERCILLSEWGDTNVADTKLPMIKSLFESCKRVYIATGGIVPFVATKTYDAYVRIHHQYNIHDLAPRILLWKEAGAKVEMFDVGETKVMIAANPMLFEKLKKLLTQ